MKTTLRAFITGLLLGALTINSMAAVFTYDTGTTIKFAPDATIAGINAGIVSADPSAPNNGDFWYKNGTGFRFRSEGTTITLGEGGSGTAAGLVSIINDSGTTTNYNPASDTDAARGTALLAAVAAATAGQTVRVGAGTFALAANRLLIPDDVCLDLDPATLITGTANLSTAGPMVRPGNRSIVRGGKIQGVAASGVSQAPFGISSFVASPDASAVDFVLDGVTLEADSDAFYILDNGTCSGTLRNCTLISKYDIIYVSGFNGDPGTHTVRFYNTRGIVVGPSTIASPLARGTTIAYGGTVDIHGGSLAISDGGTTLNAGAAAYEGGTLNLYGVKVTTSNGANPNYDLYTSGSGVINVNGGAGSGTGGIFSANSGANVTYTGNLSTGGNGTADNAKQAVYGTGGILDATTEITVHNNATAAHAYLTDDGTIGFHSVGETNPRELVFPPDVLENEAKYIATRDWVTANAAAFDATVVDAVTWSDGANASNVWTFNLSGTDPAITFASGTVNVSTGALQVAGVAVPTISSADTMTNKRITSRVATLTDAATVTPASDSYDGGILTSLSQTTDFANPTGTPTDFQRYTLRIKSTTARTITFGGTQYRFSSDMPAPTATSGSSLTDYMVFQWNAADSKWDCVGKNFGF